MHPSYQQLLGFEQRAEVMRVTSAIVVPALVQAESYIVPANHQESIGNPNAAVDDAQQSLRIRRRGVLDELRGNAETPASVSFVIAEGAVRQMVSPDPQVRIDQIEHLIEESRRFPVHLMPFDRSYILSPEIITEMTGPYGEDGAGRRVIMREAFAPRQLTGVVLTPNHPRFAAYEEALDTAYDMALSVEDTRRVLEDMSSEYQRQL